MDYLEKGPHPQETTGEVGLAHTSPSQVWFPQNEGPNNPNFQQNNGKTVTFQMQIQNLLNHTQLNGYSGTMTSSFFGRANNARQPRQVEVGLRFNF